MKTLIIGGTGWLGHNITRVFAENQFEVHVLSRGSELHAANSKAVEQKAAQMIQGDKKDEAFMSSLLQNRYEVIIDSVPSPESINLIVKHAKGLKHYLHCSSTGGYAPLPYVPCDENAPYPGFEGSGWLQKQKVDNQIMELHKNNGFPATGIRPTYITGPGLLPIDNWGNRRPSFVRELQDEETMDVANDGQALLQPLHVEDLAQSYMDAVRSPKAIGQIYIITSACAVTINRYLALSAEHLGRKLNIQYLPLGEMEKNLDGKTPLMGLRFFATHMCFSIEKAKQEIGYAPQYTPENAIRNTLDWVIEAVK